MKKDEPWRDKIWRSIKYKRSYQRYRGVAFVATVPIALITLIYLLAPRASHFREQYNISLPAEVSKHQDKKAHEPLSSSRYAVVLDAGSTGSRVHIFKFDQLEDELKLISDKLFKVTPGLSSFAGNLSGAIASLQPLLDIAVKNVPQALQKKTTISLKATAGLRLLPKETSERLLEAIVDALKDLPFTKKNDSVTILEGKDEAVFAWLTLNYLLGNVGGEMKQTVAAIDLGGGSVQEAFAIDDEAAKKAPGGYVSKLHIAGKTYNVYVHSYLGYGLMAARAKIVDTTYVQDGNLCFPSNFSGSYTYGGVKSNIIAGSHTVSEGRKKCAASIRQMLKPEKPCQPTKKTQNQTLCSFNGAWRGEGPEPSRQYYLSSYFWDRALESGIVTDKTVLQWPSTPIDFLISSRKYCNLTRDELVRGYNLGAADAPFFCFDLLYCHTLLTRGFNLQQSARTILVKQIKYNGQNIEAAWPLGAAISDLASDM